MMKTRSLLSVVLIILLFATLDLMAQAGAGKGQGRIKGKVTDPQGNPIPDVTVKFTNDNLGASFELKTNAKGEWTVNGIAGGSWNIDFVKEGYKQRGITNQITSLDYNKPVNLSLEPLPKAQEGQKSAKPQAPGMDLIQQANDLRTAKDYPGAIAKYEAAYAANPELYTVFGDIGSIYMETGDNDKAIEAFNKLLEKDPNNQEARISLASVWFKKGNADEAKKALASLNIDSISNPYTLYNIGVGFYNAQQTEEAIKYWEKAVTLDPKMVDAQFQLALGYYALKQNDKAKAAFQKVIELDPNSENAKNAQEMLDSMK
jgi:tetratricopeptide (TPR) repeat protein